MLCWPSADPLGPTAHHNAKLPLSTSHLLLCPSQIVETVSDLTTESGAWNEGLIRDIFFPVDVVAILKLPMVSRGEDIWAWEKEKHGIYSVRSAYRLQEDVQNQAVGGYDNPGSSMEGPWKLIWKLEVPPKVRVFWWRVMHDFSPAKQELHRRHLEPTAHCETCGSEEVSVRHVLTECTIARIFWEQAKKITGVKLPVFHPTSWASDLLDDRVCSRKDRAVIIHGMWSLWMQRNQRRHGESGLPVHLAV